MCSVVKYGRRYWAVLAPAGELVCVTLYRKGAEGVKTVVKMSYQVEKLPVKPRWKVRPCQEPECDISTNKRYRSPAGTVYVACMFNHAEAVYRRRNGKAATPA